MNTTPNPGEFPHSHTVHHALQAFADQMTHRATPSDGVLTARVIGEFSAGKTRLLRELFGPLIPPALFPVSSLERQTRLQLEITHGEVPALTLIEREEDYRPAVVLKTLANFPEREQLADYNPLLHRLRLALPEPRLILKSGDGYNTDDTRPKRLFLIDTPGWNSGDDLLAEGDAAQIMAGYHNLALVYVTDANRLDGAKNAERLLDFLQALADAEFLEDPTLLFVVTHCPASEARHQQDRARKLVLTQWEKLGRDADELNLKLFCVEFHEMSNAQRQTFRDDFWQALLQPLGQTDKVADLWVSAIHHWPKDWDIRPALQHTGQILNQARHWLEQARKGDEFVAGMNMHRLRGLDAPGIVQRVRDKWLGQLSCSAADLTEFMTTTLHDLPAGHPLSAWWTHYWLVNIWQALEPVKAFFRQAEQAIAELTPKTEDLAAYLDAKLGPAHRQALAALENSFTALVETAQQVIPEPQAEKAIATLMTLSLLQARYADYYAIHSTNLSEA